MGLKTLVIDDETSFGEMMGVLLRKEGYQVTVVDNATEVFFVTHIGTVIALIAVPTITTTMVRCKIMGSFCQTIAHPFGPTSVNQCYLVSLLLAIRAH